MPRENVSLHQFNRGLISPLALARTDVKRVQLSAETMVNWIPRILGSMMLRPGLQYIGTTRSNLAARFLPFVKSTSDTALIELTADTMRVWVDEELITRPSVSTTVANGDFSALTDWTDADESGAVSTLTPGVLILAGNSTGENAAIRQQTVTVAGGDQNVVHALRIIIPYEASDPYEGYGSVTLKVGSTVGGDEYITETALGPGEHSLAFTPTGDFTIELSSRAKYPVRVQSCQIESAGVMTVPTPWSTLSGIRYDQSGDVLFCCDGSTRQWKIERRATESWSVVMYLPTNGPFRLPNTSTITLSSTATYGQTNLVASKQLFRSSHRGTLFKVNSVGQKVTASVTAENQFTDAIRVTGVDASRIFTVTITGTWTATVTIQRSFESDAGVWEDTAYTYAANTVVSIDDALDNQIVWYRIGVKTGGFTSGTVNLELNFPLGSKAGIVRILGVTSSTDVQIEVLEDLGNTTATDDWSEGAWSDYRGWPSSVALVEGRLAWAGKDKVDLSVSDDFYSFDEDVEGDSGPISRSIGSGPVDKINWILALQRMLLGAEGAEFVCKSSSFDEPLSPTQFSVKTSSTQGSASVEAQKLDKNGIYVQRGGSRVMELSFGQDLEYGSDDLTLLCPDVGKPSITRIAIQRRPDTRIHAVRSDGVVAVGVIDKAENVLCWLEVETDGTVEDVVILPGDGEEDDVYYVVNRTINGSTVRYLEKWARESECEGGTQNKQLDSFVTYSGISAGQFTGLSHLEGETVAVWGNGKYLGTYTVTSGVTSSLSESITSGVAGLPYTAQWKSSKLAYAAGLGSALTQKKRISHLGVIMRNTHYQGLEYGPDFDNLDPLPLVKGGQVVSDDTVHSTYDESAFEFPGNWDTDARLCLQATAPKPCTLLACVLSVETHDKS